MPSNVHNILHKFLNLKDKKGRTLLHNAAYYGYIESVEWLVEQYKDLKMNIDPKDIYNYTPAILCCIKGSHDEKTIVDEEEIDTRVDCLKCIVDAGSDIMTKFKNYDKKDYNPLHWAVFHGDKKLASYVLSEQTKKLIEEGKITPASSGKSRKNDYNHRIKSYKKARKIIFIKN